jgi:beta-glucosidase-like glycosyl hydrolase
VFLRSPRIRQDTCKRPEFPSSVWGEDPLLSGTVVGNLMKREQAQHVAGDIEHYVTNDQETGHFFVNSVISKRAMQESDLLAFHLAIFIANPRAVGSVQTARLVG